MNTKILIQIVDERGTRWLIDSETLRSLIEMDVRQRVFHATAGRVPNLWVTFEEKITNETSKPSPTAP